jgi:hypothetical protein
MDDDGIVKKRKKTVPMPVKGRGRRGVYVKGLYGLWLANNPYNASYTSTCNVWAWVKGPKK